MVHIRWQNTPVWQSHGRRRRTQECETCRSPSGSARTAAAGQPSWTEAELSGPTRERANSSRPSGSARRGRTACGQTSAKTCFCSGQRTKCRGPTRGPCGPGRRRRTSGRPTTATASRRTRSWRPSCARGCRRTWPRLRSRRGTRQLWMWRQKKLAS